MQQQSARRQNKLFSPKTILGLKTSETDEFHKYLINLAKKTIIYEAESMYTRYPKQLITNIKKMTEIGVSPEVTLETYNYMKGLRLREEVNPPGFIYLGPLDEPGSPNVYTWFYQCGLACVPLLETPYKYDNFEFTNVDKYEEMPVVQSIKSVGSQRRGGKSTTDGGSTSSKTSLQKYPNASKKNDAQSSLSTSAGGDVSHSRKQKSSSNL